MTPVQYLLTGLLSGLEDRPKPEVLVRGLRSREVLGAMLNEDETQYLVGGMIEKSPNSDPIAFIKAISRSIRGRPTARGDENAFMRSSLLAALGCIPDKINGCTINVDEHTLDAIIEARELILGDRGTANQVLRRCCMSLDVKALDAYTGKLRGKLQLLDIFASCILSKIGAWMVWCFVRPFFLDKKPEQAEAEMERLMEINTVHGLLLGSWMHPIHLDDPNMESILMRERMHFARLQEIDPDRAVSFFEGNASRDRRED